ncbi:MAG TPA: EAL domain-containing protein [Bacillus bacterium]|nr:EAL domain-containing protein [Bacillus sp. (in: firmicutes)]
MEVFVGRQPIFNEKQEVVYYELLYRNNYLNEYRGTNGDLATTDVIVNSFLNIGMEQLSNQKPCFINFTENLLKLRVPTYFSPNSIVVEILEDVPVSDELIQVCKELKELGYMIALDDFVMGSPIPDAVLVYADIIKIDFRDTTRWERLELKKQLERFHVTFLAEKVETWEEFKEAKNDGFTYFQGYFFSKPVILNSYDIPAYYHSYVLIMNELNIEEPNIDYIADIIERDLSLSYKLLKLINSPLNRSRYEISSIKQAISFLGLIKIKKWIYILMIRGLSHDDSDVISKEVIRLSLIRAKLGELLAGYEFKIYNRSKYFLLGLMSLMDSLLHLPMEVAIKDLPLTKEIKNALLGEENELRKVLDFIKSFDYMPNSKEFSQSTVFSLSDTDMMTLYSEATKWADTVLNQNI